jgi:glycosyltransferase involved in cell wall biosynthesis
VKILHVLGSFGVGGLEKVVKDIVLHSWHGTEPSICVIKGSGRFSRDVAAAGIPVFNLNAGSSRAEIIKQIYQITKSSNIDIVHCHDLTSWLFSSFVTVRTGRPLVVTKHGIEENATIKNIVLAKGLSQFTKRIIAVSPDVAQFLAKKYFINPERIVTIFNGIPPSNQLYDRGDVKELIGLHRNAFVIGTVTRFYPVKNVLMQIDLIQGLKDIIENVKYVVVAPLSGPSFEEIEKHIALKGLGKYVHLLGYREDVARILCAMDVFLLTSLSEGTSIALLEAMQANIPVVVSRVGGNPYIVKDGVNGLIFDLDQPEMLMRRVVELHANPELRDMLGKNAGEEAKKYAIEQTTRRYYEEYCRVSSRMGPNCARNAQHS